MSLTQNITLWSKSNGFEGCQINSYSGDTTVDVVLFIGPSTITVRDVTSFPQFVAKYKSLVGTLEQ